MYEKKRKIPVKTTIKGESLLNTNSRGKKEKKEEEEKKKRKGNKSR